MPDTTPPELTLGVGAGAHLSADLPLTLPPEHPSSHGLMHVRVTVEGDPTSADAVIATAEPRIGHLHRGAEKLFEVRDYRQVLALADRHDWLGAFVGELPIALAVEHLSGMAVPERATWIRTLLAELTRVGSHLAFLGSFPAPGADGNPVRAERESVLALMEHATGSRIHPMHNVIGGVREDLPEDWPTHAGRVLDEIEAALPRLEAHLQGARELEGLGVITRETALAHGVTGPPARAAGVDEDLRRDAPALAYGELFSSEHVVLGERGDVPARLEVARAQLEVSLGLARECLARLGSEGLAGAPVNIRLPKVLRVPEGMAYAALESPLGVAGAHLVSRGDKVPWRLGLRTPSYAVVSALSEILPGTRVGDAPAVLASLFFVMGDVDK